MDIIGFGKNTSHKKGEFNERKKYPFRLITCFSTDFLYEYQGKLTKGDAGDFLITTLDEIVYHGPVSKNDVFINDWIEIIGEDFDDLTSKFSLPLNKAFKIANKSLIKSCIDKLDIELQKKETGFKEMINSHVTALIIDIFRQYQRERLPTKKSEFISLREQILKSPEKKWSQDELAASLNYSTSRFASLYKEYFGTTPKADIMNTRLEYAKRLLSLGELSIGNISEKCGFYSIYYFSKIFKKQMGLTPKQYSKKFPSIY
jgi:AraC-like DNA-binding protein